MQVIMFRILSSGLLIVAALLVYAVLEAVL